MSERSERTIGIGLFSPRGGEPVIGAPPKAARPLIGAPPNAARP